MSATAAKGSGSGPALTASRHDGIMDVDAWLHDNRDMGWQSRITRPESRDHVMMVIEQLVR